jgi:hypothetical protein
MSDEDFKELSDNYRALSTEFDVLSAKYAVLNKAVEKIAEGTVDDPPMTARLALSDAEKIK